MATSPKLYTAREEIVGWINVNKGIDLTVDQVTFMNPVPYAGPNPPWHVKTEVISNTNSIFVGRWTHSYDRIHLSKLGTVIVAKGDALWFNELLDKVSEACNTKFDIDDLENYELDGETSGNIAVNLIANPHSLMYYDGPIIYTPNNPQIQPGDPNAPVWPPLGQKLSEYCQGQNKWGVYADGVGGYTLEEITPNSPTCGYDNDEPLKVSSFGDESVKSIHEGEYVEFVYTFSKKNLTSLYFDLVLDYAGTMTDSDIESVEVKFSGSDWIPVSNRSFGIPRDKFGFTVRMKVSTSIELLPQQNFTVTLEIAQRSENDVEPGNLDPFTVNVSRSVYGSEISVLNETSTIYEGVTSIVFYVFNQPVVETTELELEFIYLSTQQKPLTNISYRKSISDQKTPILLDGDNKTIVPMSVGDKQLIIDFVAPNDRESPYSKGLTIKTKEIPQELSFVDEGNTTTTFVVRSA